jgi:hypothetical protein
MTKKKNKKDEMCEKISKVADSHTTFFNDLHEAWQIIKPLFERQVNA